MHRNGFRILYAQIKLLFFFDSDRKGANSIVNTVGIRVVCPYGTRV